MNSTDIYDFCPEYKNTLIILRIDLRSDYETRPVITGVLEIAGTYFFDAFDVDVILTKAIPAAAVRIETPLDEGYRPYEGNLLKHGDYYIRMKQ